MRDAEALQPCGLQGNGLVRVLGGGPSLSAERLQADGARVTKQHRKSATRSEHTCFKSHFPAANQFAPKNTAPQRNLNAPKPVERFRSRAGRLNTSAPSNLNQQRRPETSGTKRDGLAR